MSKEASPPAAAALLAALAGSPAPDPRVLDHAREVLWSAVAGEIIRAGPAGEQPAVTTRPAPDGQHRPGPARRRPAGAPPGQHRMSAGGQDS